MGALSDLVLAEGWVGSWKAETIMSCLESTRGLVLEQMIHKIFSWGMEESEDVWRITSMEEEISPTK